MKGQNPDWGFDRGRNVARAILDRFVPPSVVSRRGSPVDRSWRALAGRRDCDEFLVGELSVLKLDGNRNGRLVA